MKTKKTISILLTAIFTQSVSFSARADEWVEYAEEAKSAFSHCGDSYYAYFNGDKILTETEHQGLSGQRLKWGKDYLVYLLVELKGVTFSVKPRISKTKATMADKLNGLAEYEGQVLENWEVDIKAHYKAIRKHGIYGWEEWRTGNPKEDFLGVTIGKSNDNYLYKAAKSFSEPRKLKKEEIKFVKLSCDKVPVMEEKECKVIAPTMAQFAIERQQKEFKELYDSGYVQLDERESREQQRKLCSLSNKKIDLQTLTEAYSVDLPDLVPYQTWEPNYSYCRIRMDKNVNAEPEHMLEDYRICEEKLEKIKQQWEAEEHPSETY